MVNIAIVEDNVEECERIREHIAHFFAERGEEYSETRYGNGMEFLSDSRTIYDIVFMDIEMPVMNGMDAARKMRETNKRSILIFVTRLAKFAIAGYTVDALGYILKPATAYAVGLHLRRAMERLASLRTGHNVVLMTKGGAVTFPLNTVLYVEIFNHKLKYHTTAGEYEAYGKLDDEERKYGLVRCGRSFLVNLSFVTALVGSEIMLSNGETLPLSRSMKSEFIKAYMRHLGK